MMLHKKGSIKAWMRFFRAHTAILETPLAVMGAALALGTLWDVEILKWIVFGVLYHFVGYGMNSYADWKNGYDKADNNKQHHPLNRGQIEPHSAKVVVIVLMGVLMLYGEWVGGFQTISHISLAVMVIAGITYNRYGKKMDHKYMPISITHTMVFVYPYLVYADKLTVPFLLLTAAIFYHHVFQIAISGDIKDIHQDEASLLQKLGVNQHYDFDNELKPMLSVSTTAKSIAYHLSVVESTLVIAVGVVLAQQYQVFTVPTAVLLAIFVLWSNIEVSYVVREGLLNREARVAAMSRKELAGIYAMVVSLAPIISLTGTLLIIVISTLYLMITSKFMWGNWIKPEV